MSDDCDECTEKDRELELLRDRIERVKTYLWRCTDQNDPSDRSLMKTAYRNACEILDGEDL